MMSEPTFTELDYDTASKANQQMSMSFLLVKKLSPDAILPIRKTEEAAGYDISSSESVMIEANSWKLVSTGISFTVPKGTYGQLAPRSGLSCKGISVGAGVIDRDYTGHVKVLLHNHNDIPFEIKSHDRIAQLIIKHIACPEVKEVNDLEDTSRGGNGFGSTGLN